MLSYIFKIIKITFIYAAFMMISSQLIAQDSINDQKYPISGIHNKLGLACADCHKEKNKAEYSNSVNKGCSSCHGKPEEIADKTGHLGHLNNIHNSPHWGNEINCNMCHKAHKPTQNLCLQCHEQDAMKRLIVK